MIGQRDTRLISWPAWSLVIKNSWYLVSSQRTAMLLPGSNLDCGVCWSPFYRWCRVSCWSTQPVRASLPPTRSTFKRQHLVRQRKAEASTHPPTCQLACRGSFDSLPDFAAWAWSGLVWSERPDSKTLPKYMCSRLVTTSQNIGVLDFSTWNLRLSEAPDGGTGGVRGKRGWHGRI